MALTASGLVIVMALGFVGFMVSGKDYAVLLTNVPADQMPTIIGKLSSKNIPYQLKDEGKNNCCPE